MKRVSIPVGIVALAVAVGGCLPEKRVLWSPDGKWAAVRGGDENLYLCDENGKLTPRVAESVSHVAWLPDSKRLLIARSEPAQTWEQVAAVLSEEQRAAIEARGPKLRAELLAHDGPWNEFEPKTAEGLTGGETLALILYVRERLSTELAEKLGEEWDKLKELEGRVHMLQLGTVRDGALELGAALAKSADAFGELRLSPDAAFVAYRGAGSTEEETGPLFVLALAGGAAPLRVAEHVAMFHDWSADGRSVVYAATKGAVLQESKDLRLGVIAQQAVRDEAGKVLETLPEAKDLAGVVFQNEMRVRCLRDGRILFASMDVQLPCTAADMPERAELFAVEPERQPGVVRLIPRQAAEDLPDAVFLFEVSPDERHVCLPDSGGRIVMLTLATGETWDVVEKDAVDTLRIAPTWRSANELTAVVVPGSAGEKGRPEVTLFKLDWEMQKAERRALSTDWPKAVIEGVLVNKPEKAPSTQPQTEARP